MKVPSVSLEKDPLGLRSEQLRLFTEPCTVALECQPGVFCVAFAEFVAERLAAGEGVDDGRE